MSSHQHAISHDARRRAVDDHLQRHFPRSHTPRADAAASRRDGFGLGSLVEGAGHLASGIVHSVERAVEGISEAGEGNHVEGDAARRRERR
jgi:hypothetical protein